MITTLAHTALLVSDYDEAKNFYCGILGFVLVEDKPLTPEKRWVRIRAPGDKGSDILLSKAADEAQKAIVGNQAGGRVLFFLHTNNFDEDYKQFLAKGVVFTEGPFDQPHGRVAVFKDLYGNRLDLIGTK